MAEQLDWLDQLLEQEVQGHHSGGAVAGRQPGAAMWPGTEEGYIDAGAALDDVELPSFEALLEDSLLDEAGLTLPQELVLGPGCSAAGQASSGQEGSNQPGPGLRQSDSDSEGDAHSMLAAGALRLEAQGRSQQAQAQHVHFTSRQPVREQTHSDDSQTGTATPMGSSVGHVQSGVSQRRCKELDKHNQLLMGWLRGLVAENQSLRHHLGYACQQAGLPLPHMPASVHEAVQQVLGLSTLPVEEQKCAPAATGKVPIQRLRKQGPAGGTPAAKPPSRKRARQAAAGATALLGLFSFFVLAGPFAGITMLPVRTSLVSEGSMSPLAPSLARQGRVLTTAEDMLPLHTMAQTSMLHSSGPEPSHIWRLNETEPVVLMPTDLEAQDMALQQLKNAAPAALLGSYEAESQAQPGHLPGWRMLPGDAAALDGDVLSSSVGTPNTCREVFRVSGADVGIPPRNLLSLPSRKSAGSIALPPIPHRKRLQDSVVGNSDEPSECDDVIVSVMLPSRAGLPNGAVTQVDELYVVVLKPGQEISTHACSLPKPVLVT